MRPNPEEFATALHNEAELLLERSGLGAILRGYGKVHFTGSYALDLMAWRDIDVQLVLFEMWDPLDAFFALGHQIAKLRGVFHMTFDNHLRRPAPHLSAGLYWGIRMIDPDTDAEWNIDVWAVDDAHAQQNDGLMQRIRAALDDDARRRLLDFKHAFLTKDGRTLPFSSTPLYEAVLFEGLRDEPAIRAYLRQRGVEGI
ncbi:MAG: hypothetical protein R6V12_04330 [Candidatus Hydrogenedentota bacterium]